MKTKKNIIIRVGIISFLIYTVVSLITIQIDIQNKKNDIALVNEELKQLEYINQELISTLKSGTNNEYIMRIAREKLGYAFPEEKVFIDSGSTAN